MSSHATSAAAALAVERDATITPEAHPAVDVKPVDAYACGALGCRRTENLVQVTIDGYGRRVVCRDVHLHDLVAKVLGGDGRDA